jgi:hypothetical protein
MGKKESNPMPPKGVKKPPPPPAPPPVMKVCQMKISTGGICGRPAFVLISDVPTCRKCYCELRGITYQPDINERIET